MGGGAKKIENSGERGRGREEKKEEEERRGDDSGERR